MLKKNVTAKATNSAGKKIEYYVANLSRRHVLLVPKDCKSELILVHNNSYISGTTYSSISAGLNYEPIPYNPIGNMSHTQTYLRQDDQGHPLTITAPVGCHPSDYVCGSPRLHCLTNTNALFQTNTGEILCNTKNIEIDQTKLPQNSFATLRFLNTSKKFPLFYGQTYNLQNHHEDSKKFLCFLYENNIYPLMLTTDDINTINWHTDSPIDKAQFIKITKVPETEFYLRKQLRTNSHDEAQLMLTLPITAINGSNFSFKQDEFEVIDAKAFDKKGQSPTLDMIKVAVDKEAALAAQMLADKSKKPFAYGPACSIASGAIGISLLAIAIKKHLDLIALKNKRTTSGLSPSEEEQLTSLKKWRARSGLAGSALVALAAGLYAHNRRKTP